MKQIHYAAIVTVLGLVAFVTVSKMIPNKSQPEIHIMGTQFDFTQDGGVDDSLVYDEYEPDTDDQVDAHPTDSTGIIVIDYTLLDPTDSLTNVKELLFYLEGIPSFEEID